MRIGVISDTHIPERGKDIPAKVLEEFKKVDMIIHAGDFIELSVLDTLKSICPNVKAVAGNMDELEIQRELPKKQILKIGKYTLALMHGYGSPKDLIRVVTENFKTDKPDIIIFGHSHTPMNETIDGILYFNPGSPSDKIFSAYNSYGIIEINKEIKAKIIKL